VSEGLLDCIGTEQESELLSFPHLFIRHGVELFKYYKGCLIRLNVEGMKLAWSLLGLAGEGM
jgi:hypothetical protein